MFIFIPLNFFTIYSSNQFKLKNNQNSLITYKKLISEVVMYEDDFTFS